MDPGSLLQPLSPSLSFSNPDVAVVGDDAAAKDDG
ncbi:hypothetical protein A2U01_0051779 [Trifolium medium]|uniref:Uncharacterized protein n=1 Tax=Trifolium medium TaxID=97028 RepID=A0A392R2W2_9FABA|nr:hypothetical protein [Trifolium medium]